MPSAAEILTPCTELKKRKVPMEEFESDDDDFMTVLIEKRLKMLSINEPKTPEKAKRVKKVLKERCATNKKTNFYFRKFDDEYFSGVTKRLKF